ncbi:hypothetical protein CY0110_18427 [Crocosphaera chwakensis CCY0110]|uniref:Uncharacterized protein n=1 Tax=Crocosphaera chwakensis CCY0110 TaxID=391612 RepID=A3IJ17_9CHRO|nr:hypothetical protein CY0110_18427 [Crocosphaera chwakensis CCY0110]
MAIDCTNDPLSIFFSPVGTEFYWRGFLKSRCPKTRSCCCHWHILVLLSLIYH